MLNIYHVVLGVLKQLQPALRRIEVGIGIWLASSGVVVAR